MGVGGGPGRTVSVTGLPALDDAENPLAERVSAMVLVFGALAQLGERQLCKLEVTGSIPVRSMTQSQTATSGSAITVTTFFSPKASSTCLPPCLTVTKVPWKVLSYREVTW